MRKQAKAKKAPEQAEPKVHLYQVKFKGEPQEFKEAAAQCESTWQSISNVKAGLCVMRDTFNMHRVVRIHLVDRGVDTVAQVFDKYKNLVHSSIVGESQFQKIKE